MRLPHRRALTALLALLFCAGGAQAQVLRGSVVDSTGRIPIIGAVVALTDSTGTSLGRMIVSDRGTFAMTIPSGATRVRVVRIGFRPRDMRLPELTGGEANLTVAMIAIPTFLEPARVAAKQCPRRNDSQQALGLWEQASAGLLTSVVAREQNPASLKRIAFQQQLNDRDQAERQVVVVDSVDRTTNSYRASTNASKFIERGFSQDSAGARIFDAPDAEVLLDPSFGNGYCFRLERGRRDRPNQVGLAFASADRKEGRIDIDGVLWVDTLAKAIRDIEFLYRGIPKIIEEKRPGGTIAFTEMPNGVVFVNRWTLRLVDVPGGLTGGTRTSGMLTLSGSVVQNGGGEVAHASWPDGTKYDAFLSALRLTVKTPAGHPAVGRWLNLLETSYQKQIDTSGIFEIPDLLPGPYRLVVREPALAPLGLDSIATGFRFTAERGKRYVANVVLPSLEDWVKDRCKEGSRSGEIGSTLILARVMYSDGTPIPQTQYVIEAKGTPATFSDTGWTVIRRGWESDGAGLFEFCTDAVSPGDRIAISLMNRRTPLGRIELSLEPEPLSVIPIKLRR
jgi:hypothetical protein